MKSGGVTSGKGDWAWLALHPTGPVADPTHAVRAGPRSAPRLSDGVIVGGG